MNSEYINAEEVAKELGIYLKIVTSTKSFDNFNAFFNIYDESEEPCRRIAVLTPFRDLEEVNDENPGMPVRESIVDGNLWIEGYPLTINPKNIETQDLLVSKKMVEEFKNTIL